MFDPRDVPQSKRKDLYRLVLLKSFLKFLSNFFAILLAGIILLLAVRLYIAWEIKRAAEEIRRDLKGGF